VLFTKDEYNINSKAFNPLKVVVIIFLHINVILTIFLIYKINTITPELIKCRELLSTKEKNLEEMSIKKEELLNPTK